MKRKLLFLSGLLLWSAALPTAHGQALIYHPVNPSFGGNTFNYQWMLSSAQAQDRTKDPAAARATTSRTTTTSSLDNFSQSLQSQLLSRITRDLLNKQFGEQELKEGIYQLGDFQVEIRNATDGVLIRIVDGKGGETTITVPFF
ncbi:MAG: curli production assembly protein CsgF [Cytophagaceae bacterium]|nr:MAG: curli production assembly protein CsgF [Cytophagaceae bacterium]